MHYVYMVKSMGKISLLDCTLRDGGYVNKWNFGYSTVVDILEKMISTGVEIVEAGFIRDVTYDSNLAVFSNLTDFDKLLADNQIVKNASSFATMAEIAHPIPLDHIEEASMTQCDIIRVIVWKSKHTEDGAEVDALQESYEYCKSIVEKGYKLCVQPNRTDQYSDEEFVNMLNMFANLKPYAIYVVDSWGTMYSDQVLHYMKLADQTIDKSIAIGFHGHNNMMQAFSTAEKIIESDFDREIILDASIDGIGRGAGNLNLELIARYMNERCGKKYCLEPMYEIYDKFIKEIKQSHVWGSSFPFLISAMNNANPNYAAYFTDDMTLEQMQSAYDVMENDDAVLYTDKLAEKYKNIILK